MSTQQRALQLLSKHGSFAVGQINVPTAGHGQLLVKIHATALNPIDWKIQKLGFIIETFPSVLGSDNAGVVEAVGEGVTGFAKGDRVLHQALYTDTNQGGFQQYAMFNAKLTAKIPDNLSFDEAATIPVGVATAALGLFDQADLSTSIGLYPPWEEGGAGKYTGKPILVFGGGSSVGQYVIQFAKFAGFAPIISTASPRHSTFLTGLGATHVLDRNLSPDELRTEVAKIAPGGVDVVYDAIGIESTQNPAYDILAPGGRAAFVLPPQIAKEKLRDDKTIAYVQGNVNWSEAGPGLYVKLSSLLEEKVIKPNRVEVLPGGLDGIVAGLERLQNDQVSGVKLVAHPQETL